MAVVAEQPGVTRDRNYAVCDWGGRSFYLIDTGGIVAGADDLMEQLVYDQTEFAVSEADLVLFLVDIQVGVDPAELGIAKRLVRGGKKVLVAANKADSDQWELETHEFYKLGLGDPIPVSATGGRGVGDLLDKVIAHLPPEETGDKESDAVRVAVVGRPNVGKSSFINKLIGQERLIVTPQAGTTRDAVDTPFEMEGRWYVLIDTAGLRKSYKVHENIEFYTNLRTKRAIAECDVAVVLVDAADSVTTQDKRILEQVITNRRAAVLAVNKWDLIEKDSHTADQFSRQIKDLLARSAFVPVIYISALTGQRVAKTMSLVGAVWEETNKRIPTSALNELLQRLIQRQHPPSRQGKHIKFNYVTQSEVAPPTFVFFVNYPKLVDKAYVGFLSNQLRREYGFEGVPIRLKFRRK